MPRARAILSQLLESPEGEDAVDPAQYVKGYIDAKMPQFPLYRWLANLIQERDAYVSGYVTRHNSHYVHERSTTFNLEVVYGRTEDDTEENGKKVDAVDKLISAEVYSINCKIYRALEKEYDYLQSDEVVDDAITANDYTFDEAGYRDNTEDFRFEQLDARAKDTARDWYRSEGLDYPWHEHSLNEWKAELEEMGFDGVEINFTGFSSQGDGASFTAKRFDFMKWATYFLSTKPYEKGHPYTDELKESRSPAPLLAEGIDDPEGFDVKGHLMSPVARLASVNGFVRDDRSESEERWVKKLSNGGEVWLHRHTNDEGKPLDTHNMTGGPQWALLQFTPRHKQASRGNNDDWERKVLIATDERTMSTVLGAFMQRLATWRKGVPKPKL